MNVAPRPAVSGILETALHVEDLERSIRFYQHLFGFSRMASDDRFCAFAVGGQVLLLFRRGGTLEPVVLPNGVIPPHDSQGRLHFAFAIPVEDLQRWRDRLTESGVEIISEVRWDRGGVSLYFHDPDGHVIELATPGLWPNY